MTFVGARSRQSALRKLQRNSGLEYRSRTGRLVKARVFSDEDCKCPRKCNSKITKEERENYFKTFWKMADFTQQNAFLSNHIMRDEVKQRRPRPGAVGKVLRGVTYRYILSIRGEGVQVCKKYFQQTFSLNDGRIMRVLKKRDKYNMSFEDLRGRCSSVTKVQLSRVREHINVFPRFDDNYIINPEGLFLQSDLDVTKMYRMYVEQCMYDNVSFVKEHIYQQVFEEFGLDFLMPFQL